MVNQLRPEIFLFGNRVRSSAAQRHSITLISAQKPAAPLPAMLRVNSSIGKSPAEWQ